MLPEIKLRGVRADDANEVTLLLQGDTRLAWQTAAIPIPYTLASAHHFLSIANSQGISAITVSGELVGMAGLCSSGELAEIGYWVGRTHWGRGYATRAVSLLIAEARRRATSALIAEVFPENSASMRVLAKNGFERMGEVQRNLPERGDMHCLIRFIKGL